MKESAKNNSYWVNVLNNEYWVGVWIGKDYNAISKQLQKHFEDKYNFDPEEIKVFRGRCWNKLGYAPFIFVNTKFCNTTPMLYATLAHESCHAVDKIFNDIGDTNRDELFAHSVAAIVRGIKQLNKK